MGGPTGSYAAAGIALRVIAPRKPPYPTIMPSSRWRYLKEAELPLLLSFSRPGIYAEGLSSQGRGDARIPRIAYCAWKIVLELVTGNVVLSEVDVLTYVVLSEAGKHVPYGGN